MPKSIKINWFEIPVTDMPRAIAFYEEVFEIKINPMNFGDVAMGWFPPSDEAGAATGTLIQHEMYTPKDNGALLYFNSDNVAIELARVVPAGGSIFKKKTLIGEGHGYMGVFIDSEGNRIALHSTI